MASPRTSSPGSRPEFRRCPGTGPRDAAGRVEAGVELPDQGRAAGLARLEVLDLAAKLEDPGLEGLLVLLQSERGLDEIRIDHETIRRQLEVRREQEVEQAQLDKAIVIFRKSLEESAARAEADVARARAAEAEERVKTSRETEIANRRASIDVVLAEKAAQEERIAADALRVRRAVEAEAQRLLNEAENVLTDEARYSLFRRKLLEHVEGIVSASVKPMEKINDIRIVQMDGLGQSGGGAGSPSPTDEVINSALRYRVQAPLVDSLLSDIGIDGSNLAKQGGLIREASDMQRIASDAAKAKGQARKTDGDGGAKPDKPSDKGE